MSDYKCLFFHTRNCPIREQMNILDEDLKKNTIITEETRQKREIRGIQEEIRVKKTFDIEDIEGDFLERRYMKNTADWLVGEFCRICPHRGA